MLGQQSKMLKNINGKSYDDENIVTILSWPTATVIWRNQLQY